jgi:protein-tyrosine phosphatase
MQCGSTILSFISPISLKAAKQHMNPSEYIANHFGGKKGLLRLVSFQFINIFTGRYNSYRKIPFRPNRIVFVCKGNICRSALAEHYFRSVSDIPAASIGLDTNTGKAANERVTEEAKALGIDLSNHRTTAIKDFDAMPGDLYVCMEPEHISGLRSQISDAPVALLGFYGKPKRIYIHDPYMAKIGYVRFCNSYITHGVTTFAHAVSQMGTI